LDATVPHYQLGSNVSFNTYSGQEIEKWVSVEGVVLYAQTGAPQAARNRRASCMSFCCMVTRLAWIAHRFASWKRLTRKAPVASWSAMIAWLCHLDGPFSVVTCWQISRTCGDISARHRSWRGATYESLEGRLKKQQVGRFLVTADFAQCDSAWLVALLGTIGRRSY
jgi:hypothetical protein